MARAILGSPNGRNPGGHIILAVLVGRKQNGYTNPVV